MSAQKYRTEAERLAASKASDRVPNGVLDSSEVAHHQEVINAENQLRNGTITRGAVAQQFDKTETRDIIRNSTQSRLQASFARLPMRDAISVWNAATPVEKDSIHAELWKKRLAYIKDHTPAQRAKDPVWQQLQGVYADLRGR